MEQTLLQRRLFSCRSVAASLGGFEDRGVGMPREGKRLVESAIERNQLKYLRGKSFEQSVQTRMDLYADEAGDEPIKAYVNVGGGAVSVGCGGDPSVASPRSAGVRSASRPAE